MAENTVTVQVVMRRPFCDIAFQVIADDTKMAIQGAEIEVFSPDGESTNIYKTDNTGRAVFPNYVGGTQYKWVCQATGFKDAMGTVQT